MKVKLVLDNQQDKSNNCLPISQINSLEQASCEHIDVGDCCDFIPTRREAMLAVLSKMRYNGTIDISGVDLTEVGHSFIRGELTLEQAQSLIYNGRTSCTTLSYVVDELKEVGLRIISNRLDDHHYHITAVRIKHVQS